MRAGIGYLIAGCEIARLTIVRLRLPRVGGSHRVAKKISVEGRGWDDEDIGRRINSRTEIFGASIRTLWPEKLAQEQGLNEVWG